MELHPVCFGCSTRLVVWCGHLLSQSTAEPVLIQGLSTQAAIGRRNPTHYWRQPRYCSGFKHSCFLHRKTLIIACSRDQSSGWHSCDSVSGLRQVGRLEKVLLLRHSVTLKIDSSFPISATGFKCLLQLPLNMAGCPKQLTNFFLCIQCVHCLLFTSLYWLKY